MKISNYGLIYLLSSLLLMANFSKAQKNSGIFYSTLFAKEYAIKRIGNFGTNAKYTFLKDVNGDGADDAVAINIDGTVNVALSDGESFQNPKIYFRFNYQSGFVQPIMGDINGDGKADLVYIDKAIGVVYYCLAGNKSFGSPETNQVRNFKGQYITGFVADFNGNGKGDLVWAVQNESQSVSWYVSFLSENGFSPASQIHSSIENINSQFLVGDVNGDGKSDIVVYEHETGICKVALSDGEKCKKEQNWIIGFHPDKIRDNDYQSQTFLLDMDGDKKDDLILWKRGNKGTLRKSSRSDCDWWISYSNGNQFEGDQLWIRNFLSKEHKNNIPDPDFGLVGFINAGHPAAVVVALGRWLAIEYLNKQTSASPAVIDTYEAWGNDYITEGGTYDSGDPLIHDKQIKMIHDAGFTYVTMDITNGSNEWVDSRAKNFMERVRLWNQKIKPGDHKIYVNISLGRTREVKGVDTFFVKLNSECKRAWEEYYLPFKDLYYMLNNKPMVIHMINTGWEYIGEIYKWKGDRSYIDKFSNRWMDGIQTGADKDKPNAYGWIVPGINTIDKEMMPLMPGFWNGLTWYDRKEGETYRNQWLRVFQNQPASVWVNSFNETWEHTSVEPSYHVIDQFVANPLFTKLWTDYYGNRYDSFYWDMTRQYNKLFMDNVLYRDSYFEESGDPDKSIYKVTDNGFIKQKSQPVMSPVLLLPENFHNNFKGQIIKQIRE